MRIATVFVRLPFRFDVERLSQEVNAFDSSEWLAHPAGYEGNSSLPLISLNGEMNDAFDGPMKQTEKLARAPYIKQVLASFDEVFGRSRLMQLGAKCTVPEHIDAHYHWYNRVRIHIPIITNPQVIFYCGDTHVHMAAGEAWIFDAWKTHRVENMSDKNRVHLVIDTAGSSNFWNVVAASEWRCAKRCSKPATIEDRFIPFEENKDVTILTEQYNSPLVMHPGELDALILDLVSDMKAFQGNPVPAMQAFEKTVQDFRYDWRRLWSLYGQSAEGWNHYNALMTAIQMPREELRVASNKGSAAHIFLVRIFKVALNVSLADSFSSG
jgi:hypothetical protein